MQKITYRLAEFKITENQHGDLWWEMHIGLGSLKHGKCFINGDILFMKPSDSTEPGFLKGEFLDHLNKLPKWEKTKYYCSSYKIYECPPIRREQLFDGVKSPARKSVKVDTPNHISYKLHRYEIMEKNYGQLFWKSYGGLRSLKKGRCHIKGSILFLEPGETGLSKLMKKEFLQQLNQLPDWDRTKYFCESYTIYYSKTGAICRRLGDEKDLNGTGTKNVVANHKTYDGGINIKPIIVNKGDTKEKLQTLFNFCKTWVMLILKLLFGCFQIVYKVSMAIIDKWTRFRG